MAKVLLVEDDAELADVLKFTLSSRGFTVETAGNGQDALDLLRVFHFDVIVLDWMMPGVSGVDVCKQLRNAGNKTPVLMLTARTSSDDKEHGLDSGADDYLTKPFDNKELAARLRALLRRPPTFAGTTLRAFDIEMDAATRTVTKGGKEIHLRPMVTNLLEFLLRHPGQPFTAEALLERVWKDDSLASIGTVRAHMKLLRKAIDTPGEDSMITSYRGHGYRLRTRESEQFG